MTLMSDTPLRRRLRAPQFDGQAVFDPPLAEAARLFAENKTAAAAVDYDFQGQSYHALAAAARRELVDKAVRFTSAYRDADVACDAANIVLAGHQPELFHAGVWFKNFALDHLGRTLGACPINLLIDNDTLRATTLAVPTGTFDSPRIEHVPFDSPGDELPFEEREVVERNLVRSFDRRVSEKLAPLVGQPLLETLWRPIDAALAQTNNLGRCLAQLRHRYEQTAGLQSLEVPLSDVCQGESFRRFMSHLLANLPRLRDVYNRALREYRRINRIRSRTHPAAELIEQDGWLEAPFWIWQRDDPRRRRLFVRSTGDEIEIADRHSLKLSIPLSSEQDANRAVERLDQIANRGIRLRPRALISTMYARLILSDIFLHGIGGAKYDELTDMIIRRFFGFEPPRYLTLSATMLLPIQRVVGSAARLTHLDRELRDLVFHPEKHLRDDQLADPFVKSFVTQKQHWVATQPPRGQRLDRHRAISSANEQLQPFVEETRKKLLGDRPDIEKQLVDNQVFASREYSFCLFPHESLVPRLLELFSAQP